MKILVPWDLFRVGRGSNSAPGHSRISPIVYFSHLGDEVLHHGSRFSGLHFCLEPRFQSHVIYISNYKIPFVLTFERVFSETASRTVTYDIPADSALNVDGFRTTNESI